MADTEYQHKTIRIVSKEESKTTTGNTMVKITDQDNIRFSFFKKKKDGELSAPAQQFKDMDLDEGSVVRISYVIESYQDKKNITRTGNKIIGFQETNEVPIESEQPAKSATRSASAPASNRNYEEEAVGKVQSLFLAALIKSGKSIFEAGLEAKAARELAEVVVYNKSTEPSPTQEDDGLQDIPF